jgi:hypothetical protein
VNSVWPPTDENAYGDDHYKKGNFFTIRAENHPAYDLFRALTAQGWDWDRERFLNGRHWLKMTKGKRYVNFSLWFQGIFGEEDDKDNEWGVILEDFDYAWINALPHIVEFMRHGADSRKDMMDNAKKYREENPSE